MKLQTDSWHAWYYKQWYGTYNLPQSLCPYFWKLLITLLLFPITWPGTLFCAISQSKQFDGAFGVIVWLVSMCAGVGTISIIEKIMQIKFTGLLCLSIAPIFGLIVTTIVFTIMCSTIYGIVQLIQYIKSKIKRKDIEMVKEKQPSWFTEGIKSFFGKYCSMIEWESQS